MRTACTRICERSSRNVGSEPGLPLPVVAWDVDDVMNELMASWLVHHGSPCAYAALRANPPHVQLGLTLDDFRRSLDDFRLAHAAELPPSPALLAWFDAHGARAHHVAVTATSMVATPISASWIMRHFGRWIRTLVFVPSPREGRTDPTYDASKLDALARLGGADVLVDDTPKNLAGAAERGIEPVLWPRPWNDAKHTPEEALARVTQLVDAKGRVAR
jgi:hypothetical protein